MLKRQKKAKNYPKFKEADYLKGSLSSLRSQFDIKYYDLSLEFNLEERTIFGNVEATFEVLGSIDTLQFDLFENMNIDSIVFKGKNQKYYRKYNTVFILLANKLKIADIEKVSIFYNGKPKKAIKPPWDGGFVWKKDKNKKPWVSVACEEVGASLWWPLKDHLSDEPDSMKMSFTIPKDLYCVSNGNLMDVLTSGNQKTYVWKTSYSINSYNATFYIGDFRQFSNDYESNYSDFTLDYHVLPYNLEKAKTHFN